MENPKVILTEHDIYLYEVKAERDGSIKLQTINEIERKLYFSNFILKSDGTLEKYGRGNKGIDFYPYNGEYQIL